MSWKMRSSTTFKYRLAGFAQDGVSILCHVFLLIIMASQHMASKGQTLEAQDILHRIIVNTLQQLTIMRKHQLQTAILERQKIL